MPPPWPLLSGLAAALAAWWWWPPGALSRLAGGGSRGEGTLGGAARRIAGSVPSALTRWRPSERRRRSRIAAEVAGTCTLLAVYLDAGRPPRAALRIVAGALDGPSGQVLGDVLARIDLGLPEREAWAALGEAPGYSVVARDIGRAVDSGLHLADTLRGHASDARRERASAALVRARTAGVRSVVPLMLCFLPAFLLLGVVPLFGAVFGGLVG